jgi:guanylate kinase
LKQGKLIALSAPSGTGKTTICKELLRKNKDWLFSVSVTTREQRDGEIPDKDYIFITNEKFDHLI